MYRRVRRYFIGNENSLEAVMRFVRSRALGLENGIAEVGKNLYLILVEEEHCSDSGSRFFVKYRPVNPDLQPIATEEAELASAGGVALRVKVDIYPFVSDEIVVEEEGERSWRDRPKVNWRRKFIFHRNSDFAEEVSE